MFQSPRQVKGEGRFRQHTNPDHYAAARSPKPHEGWTNLATPSTPTEPDNEPKKQKVARIEAQAQ
jgi:hypothetical protein